MSIYDIMCEDKMSDRIKKGIYWGRSLTLINGCTKISEACQYCWSERTNDRFFPDYPFSKVVPREDRIGIPTSVKKPTTFAIWNDLFHEEVHFDFIDKAIDCMLANPRHYYFVLTKRPERIVKWIERRPGFMFPSCIFIGTTVENQAWADIRVKELLNVPATVRFLSVEPMLGPVTIKPFFDLLVDYKPIHWVICGCESGNIYRDTKKEWVECLIDECVNYEVPVFLKQLRNNDNELVKLPYFMNRKWKDYPNI